MRLMSKLQASVQMAMAITRHTSEAINGYYDQSNAEQTATLFARPLLTDASTVHPLTMANPGLLLAAQLLTMGSGPLPVSPLAGQLAPSWLASDRPAFDHGIRPASGLSAHRTTGSVPACF